MVKFWKKNCALHDKKNKYSNSRVVRKKKPLYETLRQNIKRMFIFE